MPYIWQRKNWPHFTWDAKALIDLLGQVRLAQGKLMSEMDHLGLLHNQESQAEVLIAETITTSAIEGQQMNEKAVRSSVARRLGLPHAGLPEPDKYTEGLVDVLQDATNKYLKPLTTKRLKGWQAAFFPTGYSGMHKIKVGAWRGDEPMQVVSGPIGKETIHYEAPLAQGLNKEINQFISWWEKESKKTDGIIRAGIAHFYFVTIHPFEDGNGRIARALTDMALAQDEKQGKRYYSLSTRIMKKRKDYYAILGSCQKGSRDITAWLVWFLKCVLNAMNDSKQLVIKVMNKADFMNLHAQTEMNARQRKVVQKLVEAGPGQFEGGLTTRKYIGMTKVSRATAFREINDLLLKKVLKQNTGVGSHNKLTKIL